MYGFAKFFGTSALALGLTAGIGAAATIEIDTDGKLIGATGVDVGGEEYDVAFLDSDCPSVFDGCLPTSQLTFNTAAEATMASQALFDQVLLGNFSADPGNIFGIDSFEASIYTVFSIDDTSIDVVTAYNHQASFLDEVRAPLTIFLPADTSPFDNAVWARWSLASDDPDPSPVPLPAGMPLMLMGLLSFGVVRRKNLSA